MKLRLLAVTCWIVLSQAFPSLRAGAEHPDGTTTAAQTRLMWVADSHHAVNTGFGTDVVLSRLEALRFIAAMNSGTVENFGYSDWRLPTYRELLDLYQAPKSHSSRRTAAETEGLGAWLASVSEAESDNFYAWPVRSVGVLSSFSQVVLFATNSMLLSRDTQVLSGHVVVNSASPGPTLNAGLELNLDKAVKTPGGTFLVAADSIKIDQDAVVGGPVYYNQLSNGGTILGGLHTPLSLPVFSVLPPFREAPPRPGAPAINVASGQTLVRAAGDYGAVVVANLGTLRFSGGIYNVASISAGSGAELLFDAGAEVRVSGKVVCGDNCVIGSSSGAGVNARDIVFYIGGANGTNGALQSIPPAAQFGKTSTVQSNLYVPNGTMAVDRDSILTGAFLARDLQAGQNNRFSVDSFFANRSPVAAPQDVYTNGATPLQITLTGSDPDGDDLTFAIVSGPNTAVGTLGPVTQAPTPFPGNPPGCNPANGPGCIPPDPPRTSATVTYTPVTGDNLANSFVFRVQDPSGATGMATVRINPPEEATTPTPPVNTVLARSKSVELSKNQSVTITLTADAPTGVSLTFSLVAGSGPANGTLSPLIQGSEVPQRSAKVTYAPNSGFVGVNSFGFQACGTISATQVCNAATVTITVVDTNAAAFPQQVQTPANTPVDITLGGAPGIGGAGSIRMEIAGIEAAFLNGAQIAGNTADANSDSLGDNHNALPGSVPVLMSAGIGQTGGAGSNGVVRMQIEWDISGIKNLAGKLQSAQVLLHTNRGTVDSLDTSFFVGTANQDGLLTDADFQAPAVAISGVVMPVPTSSPGTDGTFTFDVLNLLEGALQNDSISVFSIQGRVNETLAGPARGLQVYTTASGNLGGLEPQLSIATPGVTAPPLTFSILSLPAFGTLKDGFSNPVTTAPSALPNNQVRYTPSPGFVGTAGFQFQVSDGSTTAVAQITIIVGGGNCIGGVDGNGRPCP